MQSGAGAWMATMLVQRTPALTQSPLLLIVALLLMTAPVCMSHTRLGGWYTTRAPRL